MQSILVLKLAHEWEATCWHSLRSDDIALIVLCYRTANGKNRRQEQVWRLFVTLCNTGSFFSAVENYPSSQIFQFSFSTFLRNRRLGLLIFPTFLSFRWHSMNFSLTLYFLNPKNDKPFPHNHQQWREPVAESPPLKCCSSPPRTQFPKNMELTYGFSTILPSPSMAVTAPAKATGQCTLYSPTGPVWIKYGWIRAWG